MLKNYIKRLISLMFGLMLYGIGVTMTIKGNIGYSPWDVFHVGVSKYVHTSIGNVSIIVGIIIGLLTINLGEKLGLGTVANMIFIGVFINIFMPIIPMAPKNSFVVGIAMLITGLFIISFGSYFYIKSGFGAGPRDSLMVVLRRKTKLSVGTCRGIVEGVVLFIGWILGGLVGIGTAISMFGISFCIQIVFSILKFDPSEVNHETISETYDKINKKKFKKNCNK